MLKFIGTGSAFNTQMVNTSAYIKEEWNLFIIDSVETSFSRMKKLIIFEDVEKVYIAITHMHSDHIGSLGTLVEYLNIKCGIVPNIVITNDDLSEAQEDALRNYLTLIGVNEDEYDFAYCDMLENILPNLNKVEMVEVKHSNKLTSYALELYFTDKTIYYTGDHIDKEYLNEISAKLTPEDLVYTDCTNRDYAGRIHITIDELSEIFNENQREQVYCMHFDSYGVYSDAKAEGFKTANSELSIEELLKQIANRK
ncbi:MAG: MBL fold metallo-hydrolase [Clostridia bacterium]|nr:MBL fold metallo-hydrolase [Clostridia bacterium]